MRHTNILQSGELIRLKSPSFLFNQRIAGRIAAEAILLLKEYITNNTTKNLIELDDIVGKFIIENNCYPTFKNYKNFPNNCCFSINKILVHGVATKQILQKGDAITFDLGTTFNGAIADTAATFVYGESTIEQNKLIKATQEALYKGISVAKVGNRIGDIGHAIYKSAKGNGYDVYTRYGGHGICVNNDGTGRPHAPPFVSNRSLPHEGVRIQPGMTIAIEPLLTRGSTETYIANDGWTVEGKQLNCHFEHTIFIHEDHIEIITKRPDEDRIH